MNMFAGKTAIVTGAASGMGKLCAERFAREGANAVLADINGPALEEIAESLKADGLSALAVPCDVRKYDQVKRTVEEAVHAFGSVDILVNFAGGSAYRIRQVPPGTEFHDVPIDVYDWGIDVNFKGQFYFAHAVCGQMARQERGGVIINIGSVAGVEGNEYAVDYSASKSGVMNGLTRSLALYGEKHRIRCVCVSPGPVMTRPGMASMNTLLGRGAEPWEIVDLILYAASEKGAFFNGVDLLMDGGRSIVRDKH